MQPAGGSVIEAGVTLLSGEKVVQKWQKVDALSLLNDESLGSGTLVLSDFRIWWQNSQTNQALSSHMIPLTVLRKFKPNGEIVAIRCKDARIPVFRFPDRKTAEQVVHRIASLAFAKNIKERFAFKFAVKYHSEPDGWQLYEPLADYNRMGLPNEKYRISVVNKKFAICPTYPEIIVVPATISDETLQAVAKYRSRGRIPAVVWRHPRTHSTLSRCSQPKVGLLGNKSKEDVELIKAMQAANEGSHTLYFLDPRPKANAVANTFRGGGYEAVGPRTEYADCVLQFGNIENIHVMRKDLRRLHLAWRETKQTPTSPPSSPQGKRFVSASDGTRVPVDAGEAWLQHVRLIWKMAAEIVELLEKGSSVLSHCSDGWDRTAQVVSLAQLALDPHCRTIRGFCTLIQKEWCAFGHKFAERHGHDSHIADAEHEQRAPIFLQFLDAVFQMLVAFPSSFQFSSSLLVSLADHTHACLFGTFLVNSPSESVELNLPSTTQSYWSFVLANASAFANAAYEHRAETLLPKPENFVLWSEYHNRWHNAAKAPGLQYLLPEGHAIASALSNGENRK